MRTVFVLFSLLIAPAALAQELDLRACRPSLEVQRQLESVPQKPPLSQLPAAYFAEQKPRFEALAKKYPRDVFVQRRLVRFLREGVSRSRSGRIALSQLYRLEWEKDRKDPLALYLLAEAIADDYSSTARGLLEGLTKEQPEFPWAHFALAELHQRWQQPDNDRAALHALRFVELCPDAPEGFELLRGLTIPAPQAGLQALRLRTALEAMPWEVRLQWMPTLWDVEMQGLDADQRADEGRVVEVDLAEILELGRADRAEWFEAIEAAASITGDAERTGWAKVEIRKRRAVEPRNEHLSAFGSWRRDHAPASDADWAELQEYYRRTLAESEKWTARWPTLEQAWQRRLEAAAGLDELAAETVLALGDAALGARERALDDSYRPELRYGVAQTYLKHGVRLDQVEKLAKQPLQDEIAYHRKHIENDPAGPSERNLAHLEANWPRMFRTDAWMSNTLVAELAWRERNVNVLTAAVRVLERDVLASPEGEDHMRMEEFARQRTQLHRAQAWLADLQGQPDTALDSYARAVAARPTFTEKAPYLPKADPYFGDAVKEEARRYWVERGRPEGALATSLAVSGGAEINLNGPELVWFTGGGRRGFPEGFSVTDFAGKRWTRASFVGRPGLLAIWPARYDWYWKNLALVAQGLGESTPFLALAVGANATVFEQIIQRENLRFAVAPADTPLGLRFNTGGAPCIWIVNSRSELVKFVNTWFSKDTDAIVKEFRKALAEAE